MFLLYVYVYVCWALVYHYWVSNILQHIKTVNKMWWYKLLFFKLYFEQNKIFCKKVKTKMFIVVIWLSLYSSFFFCIIFQCFTSICFLIFFNIFCIPPHNQENHDLSNCHYEITNLYTNMKLIWDWKLVKYIYFSLCIVALCLWMVYFL